MKDSTKHFVPKPRFADLAAVLLTVFALLFVRVAGVDAATTPQSTVQFKWRVATSAPYSQVRPAIGPDGSVYAVDVHDNLIAVAPDGTELWRVADAGSKGVDVGGDGTIYTGNENWIKAFYPDGSLKWTYTQDPRAFVLIDVAVGPDGNIYAVASSGMGVFSLADGGHNNPIFRWKTPEPYARTFIGYTEIAFGLSATPGCFQQLYFYANGHTRAVCLEDGSSIFTLGGGNTRPKVSPVDNTWHRGDSAYSPDGVLQWRAEFPLFASFSEPSLAWDGTHYTIIGGNELYALDMLGTVEWTAALNENVGLPDVDPTKSVVITPTSSSPLALKAVSAANGRPLWRMEFPADDSGLDQEISSGVAYSANGDAAYVMTFVNGANRTYLNAVNTGLGGTDPGSGGTDPGSGGTDPGSGGTDPGSGGTDPGSGGTDPGSGGTDPGSGGTDPASGGTDPASGGTDPASGGTDPASGGTDPASGATDVDQTGADSESNTAETVLSTADTGPVAVGTGSINALALAILAGVPSLMRIFRKRCPGV